jgi:hypothetical protein
LRVFGEFAGEKFESYGTAQGDVFGFVNHAHAAAAEFFDDAVVRDGAADEGLGVRHECAILKRAVGQVNSGRIA